MKILMCNRDHRLWSGGDSNKINQYMKGLREKNLEVDLTYSIEWPDYRVYDIIHGYHLGHRFSYKFYLEAKRLNKPFIISTIFFPDQGNTLQYRKEMCEYASAILVLSEGEKNAVLDNCGLVFENKIRIIPNGIHPIYGEDSLKYVHPNCPNEEYVLCVGRLDDRKNQVILAQACKELDIPLLLVGEPGNEVTNKQLEAIGKEWNGLWWERSQPPEMLVEAYNGAKVLACPSTLEMWPNVVAEGGLCGCNLVVSRKSMSFSDLPFVYACEPNKDSIKEAVAQAYFAPKTDAGKEHFKAFTWERAVERLIEVYGEAT